MSPTDDDLPDVEIETIKNMSGKAWPGIAQNGGALLRLDGPGVRDNGVDIKVMSHVLEHFNQLVHIIAAYRSGLEVKRHGRVTEVKGTRRLVVTAPLEGSFVLPLRLDPPDGQLFPVDKREVEGAVELVASSLDEIDSALRDLPERAGDEFVELLDVVHKGVVNLNVAVVREGKISARATVAVDRAKDLSRHLETTSLSGVATEILSGLLFRIDTRQTKIAMDVATDDEGAARVVEAMFSIDQLDALKQALHKHVDIEVDVVEEKRPYERTARGQIRTVVSIGG